MEVFRERREAVEQLLPLTLNYRSRPEVLAAVNELFGSHFGDEFQPLAARGRVPRSGLRPSRSSCSSPTRRATRTAACTGGAARRARSRGACASSWTRGAATPGEIVLLFAAGTDAEWYEDELRRAGLPTYRATGKGYFGQQQVVDLLCTCGCCRTATTTRRS